MVTQLNFRIGYTFHSPNFVGNKINLLIKTSLTHYGQQFDFEIKLNTKITLTCCKV